MKYIIKFVSLFLLAIAASFGEVKTLTYDTVTHRPVPTVLDFTGISITGLTSVGATTYFGTGVPGVGIGVNGDVYVDSATGLFYKKAAGAWGSAQFSAQPLNTNLTSWAALAPSAKQDALGFTAVPTTTTVNGHALSSNVSVTPTDLGLVIGTNVQAYNANLTSWAALAPSAKQDALGFTAVPNTRTVAGKALNADVTLVSGDVGLSSVTNDVQTKAAVVPNTLPSAGQLPVGNAGGTAYVPVAVSGDATLASTGAITIAANAVTNAKAAQMANLTYKGRHTAGTGNAEDVTIANLKSDLGIGATATTGTTGTTNVVTDGETLLFTTFVNATTTTLTLPASGAFEVDIIGANGTATLTTSATTYRLGDSTSGTVFTPNQVSAANARHRMKFWYDGTNWNEADTFSAATNLAGTGAGGVTGVLPAANGGAATITGTGFVHATSGVQDGASKLVDTADINNNQVTNAKAAQMATNTIKGNNTGSTANAADLTVTLVNAMTSGPVTTAITYYVAPAGQTTATYNGSGSVGVTPSDSNDGLTTATPFATIAKAVSMIANRDLQAVVTIQLADTDATHAYFPSAILLDNTCAGGSQSVFDIAINAETEAYPVGYLYIKGNTTTPGNVILTGATTYNGTVASANHAFLVHRGNARFQGFKEQYFKGSTIEGSNHALIYAETLTGLQVANFNGQSNDPVVGVEMGSTARLGGTWTVNEKMVVLGDSSSIFFHTPLGYCNLTFTANGTNPVYAILADEFCHIYQEGLTSSWLGTGSYNAFVAFIDSSINWNGDAASTTTINAANATLCYAFQGGFISEALGAVNQTGVFTAMSRRARAGYQGTVTIGPASSLGTAGLLQEASGKIIQTTTFPNVNTYVPVKTAEGRQLQVLHNVAGSQSFYETNFGFQASAGTLASPSVVASGRGLGILTFSGFDGTQQIGAAWINGAVDGTPGTNDMPGRLEFYTTPDGTANPVERVRIKSDGSLGLERTITAGGTTGNQTINKQAGTVNIAAAGTTVTVTNAQCTTSSIVFAVIRTNDSTATIKNVVPGAGSFVINLGASATAEVSIGYWLTN